MRTVACALAIAAVHSAAAAQSAPLARAMQLETAGQLREASASYREALGSGDILAALLGLERVYAQLGWNDTLVVVARGAIKQHPGEPTARVVLLRALHTLRRGDEERAAFNDWISAVPGDIEPFRAYARLLLADGKPKSVDSLLQAAQTKLGSLKGLTSEIAQLRVTLGQWDAATVAWREAIMQQPSMVSAAEFSLRVVPPEGRRVVRAGLLAVPVTIPPRRLLAMLELGWGNGREAWGALSDLPLDDSTAALWQQFAQDAQENAQYLAARDALVALQRWKPETQRALRAASLALDGGDNAGALTLATQASERLGADGPKLTLRIRLSAYAGLGRGSDAQKAYRDLEDKLPPTEASAMRRIVAAAWVRGGGVTEARAILAGATPDPDDELTGWLALFEGNLAGARRGLRRSDPHQADAVFALSFISRTKVDSAPLVGAAFLTLARGDTIKAAAAFARAADQVTDASSVLLLQAARLHDLLKRDADAIALWQRILATKADAPEAAEAELDWARLLRRRGDLKGAREHLEHLILTWPQSALLPQARQEMDLLRAIGDSDV